MKKLLVFFAFIIFSFNAHSSALTASDLLTACEDLKKGSLGEKYDAEKAVLCKAYISAFFDNIIIFRKLAGTQLFCIPDSVLQKDNFFILEKWVNSNKTIADKTTATVALYSAYKIAFPCQEEPNPLIKETPRVR